MNFATVAAGLCTRLDTLTPAVLVRDNALGKITPPAAVVPLVPEAEYDFTKGNGLHRAVWPVYVFVGAHDARVAHANMAPFLSTSGGRSVKAAIEGDVTLGGSIDTCRVLRASVGIIAVAGVDLLGARFDVECIG